MGIFDGILGARSAVGLIVGSGSVSGVRVVRGEDGLRVDGSTRVEFPVDRGAHPAELESALTEAAETLGGFQSRIVMGLSARDAALHLFKPPFDRPEKVIRVLKYDAEPLFLTSVEELVIDYLPLQAADGSPRGVVFGAKPDAVAAALDDAAGAGLEAEVVLPDRLGLLALGRRLFGAEGPRFHLLADLGATQTGLVFFDRGQPKSTRSVYYGGRDITRRLAEKLNLGLAEAEERKRAADLAAPGDPEFHAVLDEAWGRLVNEIERSLIGALGGDLEEDPVVVLTGGAARTPGLADWLSDRLGLPVTLLSDHSAEPGEAGAPPLETGAAAGLAFLGLEPGYRPNLRQGDLAPRAALGRYKTALSVLAAGLFLLAAINIGGLIYTYQRAAGEYERLKDEIRTTFTETVPGVTRVVDPLAQMRQEVAEVRGQSGVDRQSRVLDVLLGVSQVAENHEGLRITDLSYTPESLEMSGEGGSFEVIDLFKGELAALPYFAEASVGGARVDPVTKVLTFRITCRRTSS